MTKEERLNTKIWLIQLYVHFLLSWYQKECGDILPVVKQSFDSLYVAIKGWQIDEEYSQAVD